VTRERETRTGSKRERDERERVEDAVEAPARPLFLSVFTLI
jgi:hypothetical protein